MAYIDKDMYCEHLAELKYSAEKNGKIAEAFEYARAITRIQQFPNAEVEEAIWISVEEKPLKNGVDEAILLYVQTDGCKPYITTGYFYSDKFLNNGMCEQDGVTHWRPLPSPPKT